MVGDSRPRRLDELSIHQVCLSGQCDFATSLHVLRDNGVRRTALWAPMIETCGLENAKAIWDDSGMTADSLCAAELFAGPDKLRQMLDWADQFGARTLVLITGGLESAPVDGDIAAARQTLVPLLAAAGDLARPYNVQLAFEPLHPMVCGLRSIVSSLGEALDQLYHLDDRSDIGLAIDAYAFWWESHLAAKLARAGDRILNYHVSDWLADTNDLRLDRGMPGDGQINLLEWRQMVEAAGYDGPVEVEIFSRDRWWKTTPESVVHTIIERLNLKY